MDHLQTFEIDCDGDILLVITHEDPTVGNADQGDVASDNDTDFADADSVDTLIAAGVLVPTQDPQQAILSPAARRIVRFRVDSCCLRASSPYFAELLDQHYGYPGAAEQLHFPTRIPIYDDNPAIIQLILQIIHEDHRPETERTAVAALFPTAETVTDPLRITIPTLADIATTAGKYRLQFALSDYLETAIANLWTPMTGSSTSDAIAWVWITWVFELTDHFAMATEHLARISTKSLEHEDLEHPIPRSILNAINRQRLNSLTELCGLFLSHYESHISAAADILDRCDAITDAEARVAATVRHARNIGLLLLYRKRLGFWPEPDPDFRGSSFSSTVETIRAMVDLWDSGIPSPAGGAAGVRFSDIPAQVTALLECLEERDWGLAIDNFTQTRLPLQFTY